MSGTQMNRAVERKGKHVEFWNMVGAYMGQNIKYRCATIEGAEALEAWLKGKDEAGMPNPLTREDASTRFGAVELRGNS